jgi:hypothetical protein
MINGHNPILFLHAGDEAEARDMIRSLRILIPDIERIPCLFIEELDEVPQRLTNPDGEYVIFFRWTDKHPHWDLFLTVWDKVRFATREALDDGHLHVVIPEGITLPG